MDCLAELVTHNPAGAMTISLLLLIIIAGLCELGAAPRKR
jgi:hypothetical protein